MKFRLLLAFLSLIACDDHATQGTAQAAEQNAQGSSSENEALAWPAADTLQGFTGTPDLADSLGSTTLSFGSAALILQGRFPIEKRGDTLVLSEIPMRYVYQKNLRSQILDSTLNLKAYLSLNEQIRQIYPHTRNDSIKKDFDTWKAQRQQWQAWQPYKYLPLEQDDYRIPLLNRLHNEDPKAELFQSLNLKDTLIEYPGEMGGTKAEFLFIGKPAAYSIPKALIKVEIYEGEALKAEHYVSIIFSYGC